VERATDVARQVLVAALRDPAATRDTVVAAQRLLERLRTLAPATVAGAQHDAAAIPKSRWQKVPMRTLLEEAGNLAHAAGNGSTSGHEPVHASGSGTCLFFNPATGWWRCASCGEHGDAVALHASLHGISRKEAARVLAQRFGRPTTVGASTPQRPKPIRRVLHG
jgi:hypothetical protein